MWMLDHPAITWTRVDPISLGADVWIVGPRWQSEEQAEQKALEDVARFNAITAPRGLPEIIRYIRAEYFPEYS